MTDTRELAVLEQLTESGKQPGDSGSLPGVTGFRPALLPSISTVVDAVRARGGDARDLRDAVHEAHHAVVAKLKRPWERERIHQALLRMPRVKKWGVSMLVNEEIDARSVERVACDWYEVAYDTEHWAMMAAMETCKTFGTTMPLDWWVARIVERSQSPRIGTALHVLLNKLARKATP